MSKRIKLVISDLHLGRGRRVQGGQLNALEEFYYDAKLIEFIQYHTSGEFRDAEVELIINGDFLNFLQVDYRGHFLTVLTESVCLEQLQGIVQGHADVFQALREFAADPKHSITYVVGNHDQAMLWPALRAYLNQAVGTAIRFKNLVYNFDGVHIEHGHMHEAANRFDPKKFFLKKSLPEPILNLPFGSHFFVDFVLKLKQFNPHVDKVRPFGRMLRWSFVNHPIWSLKNLFRLAQYFSGTILKKDPRRRYSIRSLAKVVLESAIFPDLSEAARRILMTTRAHTVVFGHCHVYQYRQWAEDKEYFNTGTWTELTSLDLPHFGKITKLTYVLFEYDSEGRPRGRLKEWRGFHRAEEDVVIS